MFSWLAASYVAAGLNVAMPNYRFAPQVRIDDIVEDAIAALNWIGAETQGPLVLSGHSAGGHLVAALLATPASHFTFDTARIVGGVPVSGIVDFEPLLQFSFNADFRMDAAAARRLSLHDKKPALEVPLVVAVGANESSEFVRQSKVLAAAWSPQVKELQVLPGLNHFSVVDAFAERGQRLHDATLALFEK